ncbi:SAM hydrolase/SAM-dependent halogenase family protein [Thermomonospora cellulosilytica]|uniref:S-adenosylmethionine hydrolase n=1 Tax=Thermomonospora cellulosilytica TaxID=1411118 RepID=A0A7W3MWS4_9ACTN|nr:SAM-dependent chlorinase/fluorinase [Thermomonospora cellulosilytica]MBA9003333.1 S-adenosylmethionine hydrolase [Thermomonospora cellulosilytica]
MAAYQCLTFLTDYGLEDGFVAACHGVAARISPDVRIIDITHLVPPGDVRRGAAVLAQTVPYLPPGVHVAVVDPGVGTRRRGIAVAAGERVFVGPDNGLLSWAVHEAAGDGRVRAYELTNEDLWLRPVSATFHGRDIFTPVAAHLLNGLDITKVGSPLRTEELVTLPTPMRRIRDDAVEGEVLTVDRFGNVQLSVPAADLELLGVRPGGSVLLSLGKRQLPVRFERTFGSVPPGELVAYADSAGCVALAVNSGDAAQRLNLPPGAHVRIAPAR